MHLREHCHLSKCKNSIQYYRYMPADESNGTYIPKSDIEQIHRLAQKSYDQKIQKLAGKRLSQIKKLPGIMIIMR